MKKILDLNLCLVPSGSGNARIGQKNFHILEKIRLYFNKGTLQKKKNENYEIKYRRHKDVEFLAFVPFVPEAGNTRFIIKFLTKYTLKSSKNSDFKIWKKGFNIYKDKSLNSNIKRKKLLKIKKKMNKYL